LVLSYCKGSVFDNPLVWIAHCAVSHQETLDDGYYYDDNNIYPDRIWVCLWLWAIQETQKQSRKNEFKQKY